MKRAFTLIELLVVISVIGLLSSVVLASLNTARDKARIAGGKEFAAQVEHAAGEQAIAIYEFDECSGSTALDRSGYALNGTLIAAATSTWSTDTPSNSGCSLLLNGTSQYANLGTNLVARRLSGASAVTVAAWIKNASLPVAEANSILFMRMTDATPTAFHFLFEGNALKVGGRSGSSDSFYSLNVPYATTGQWRYVVGILDFENKKISTYIDGRLAGTANAAFLGSTFAAAATTNADGIGYAPGFDPLYYFNGQIDAVRVYAKALTADDVRSRYAEGAPLHGLAVE